MSVTFHFLSAAAATAVKVQPTWDGWRLKNELRRRTGLPPDQVSLIFHNTSVDNDRLLVDQGIAGDADVYVVQRTGIRVFVQMLGALDQTTEVIVPVKGTIRTLKLRIQDHTGVYPCRLRIARRGAADVGDAETFASWGIRVRSRIVCWVAPAQARREV